MAFPIPSSAPLRLPVAPWRWWHLPIALVVAFMAPMATDLFPVQSPAMLNAALLLSFGLGALLVAVGLMRSRVEAAYSLSPGPLLRTLVIAGLTVLVFKAMVWVASAMDPELRGAGKSVIDGMGFGESLSSDVTLVLCITVFAPMGEELMFRGLMYRVPRDALMNLNLRWLPPLLCAALATALSVWMFTGSHGGEGQDQQMVMLGVMAVVYVVAYEVSGSMLAPIMAHAINNAWALGNGLTSRQADLAAPWLPHFAYAAPLLTLALSLGMAWAFGAWQRRAALSALAS